MRRRRRFTRGTISFASAESLRALARIVGRSAGRDLSEGTSPSEPSGVRGLDSSLIVPSVSGGGSAERASGEDESSIPAAFPGVVSKRALYPNLGPGFWERDALATTPSEGKS